MNSSMNVSKLVANPEVAEALSACRALLRDALPSDTFAKREEAALALGNELVRGVLEEELQEIADSFGDEVLVDGVAFRRHEPGAVVYHSLCGALAIQRYSYRQMGIHNGPTVVPLELYTALVERATPALAFNVAHAFAQYDMRLHEEQLRTAHRVPPSRTTLERMANRMAEAAVQDAPRIERQLRRAESLPSGVHAISIGLDRTAVAMLEPRSPGAPPKPEPKRSKPRIRRPPPPADINWRMAYVGTVSMVNADGEALLTRRYALPACDDPRDLVACMTADVRAALRRDPALNVGIVQDGAPEMWNRTREGLAVLKADGVLDTWHEGVDRFHLAERIGAALQLFDMDDDERKRLRDDWHARFDYDDATIETVERYFRRRHRELPADAQAQLWEHLKYIRNNKDRMRYATLRAAGLPVGSGVTESAARTLVGQRAKGCGRRWSEHRLRGVLTLRALRHSERLTRFWSRFVIRYTAHVQAA